MCITSLKISETRHSHVTIRAYFVLHRLKFTERFYSWISWHVQWTRGERVKKKITTTTNPKNQERQVKKNSKKNINVTRVMRGKKSEWRKRILLAFIQTSNERVLKFPLRKQFASDNSKEFIINRPKKTIEFFFLLFVIVSTTWYNYQHELQKIFNYSIYFYWNTCYGKKKC